MKIRLLSYLLIFVAIAMISCGKQRTVAIDIPYDGDKIVLNSIMTNDSIVYAHITKSASAKASIDSLTELSGCTVDLYENNQLKETLAETLINGRRYYVSKSKTLSNRSYTLKASGGKLQGVEGTDQIPAKPGFSPLEFWKISNPPDSLKPYRMTIKIKDPAGEKNYYRLKIYSASYNTGTKRYTINKNSEISFSLDNFIDELVVFGVVSDNLSRTGFFTDDTFNGQEITLNLSLRTASGERLYVAPELMALSKQAYLYFDSKKKQENNKDNPFSEAVIVYNNISGGYGIVGGMADSITVIKRLN